LAFDLLGGGATRDAVLFFGLLRDAEVLGLATGRPWTAERFTDARLADARLVRLRGETFPMLVPATGVWTPGVLVEGLTEADLDRIRFYESVEYEPSLVEVEAAGGDLVEARAFATTRRAAHDEEAWSFEDWSLRDKAHSLREADVLKRLLKTAEYAAERLKDQSRPEGRDA